MATERQIAANRRNALKSTGPRSAGGKKRASRNAHRHGLAAPVAFDAQVAREVDRLARQIAGNAESAMAEARTVAEAFLELARVRRISVELIDCVTASGRGSPPERIRSSIEPTIPLPAYQPDRSAEALRRALPSLARLDRYERRAAIRLDRAVREFYNFKTKYSLSR